MLGVVLGRCRRGADAQQVEAAPVRVLEVVPDAAQDSGLIGRDGFGGGVDVVEQRCRKLVIVHRQFVPVLGAGGAVRLVEPRFAVQSGEFGGGDQQFGGEDVVEPVRHLDGGR